jgi:hypothetical protein
MLMHRDIQLTSNTKGYDGGLLVRVPKHKS